MVPSVSCLVVSRTPRLLNRMLQSLEGARRFWRPDDEVLCSWNGCRDDEAAIISDYTPRLRIATRAAYHFAANMNSLASQASGDILVLINDDVVLDPGSLDQAIQILLSRPDVGVVGGRLRKSDGGLSHAGILFGNDHQPYNRLRPDRLGSLIQLDGLEACESGPIPAVTGALMVIERQDFQRLRFRETFRICGEDVVLCLDLKERLGKWAYYASDVTAIHDEKSTRGEASDHFDRQQVAAIVVEFIRRHPDWRACIAHWIMQEADLLELLIHELRAGKATPAPAQASSNQREEIHQALLTLQHQLEFLVRSEVRRQWLRRACNNGYRGLTGWLRGSGRRS